mgnify:CR=1 FL=1
MWFTKHGSFEKEIGKNNYADNIIKLKAFDESEEIIPFGHVFPAENTDIEKLKENSIQTESKSVNIRLYSESAVAEGTITTVEPAFKKEQFIVDECD